MSQGDLQQKIDELKLQLEQLRLEQELQQQEQEVAALQQRAVERERRKGWGRFRKNLHSGWRYLSNALLAITTNLFSNGLRISVWLAVLALIILLALGLYENWRDTRENDRGLDSQSTQQEPASTPVPADSVLARANEALEAADRATNSVDRLLSFLQVMSVFIAIASGAASVFGVRSTQETRRRLEGEAQTLKQEAAALKLFEEKLQADQDQLSKSVQSQLDQFAIQSQVDRQDFENRIEALTFSLFSKVNIGISSANDLAQANTELRAKNYEGAYQAVLPILEHFPDNRLALYIAGWIELQYIPGKLDAAIEHLKKALQVAPGWPSAIAAYGVALRRQAVQAAGLEREALLVEAEGYLRRALVLNPSLLDLNLESYWGPIAGILRDKGKIDEAIEAYDNACQMTPFSSYPHGNLAALYLRKAKEDQNPEWRKKALDLFAKTVQLAEMELSMVPNDYYHIMDIAMSRMMLSQREPREQVLAETMLDAALSIQPTPEMLVVSQRGWQYLMDYCPDDWGELRGRLSTALERIAEAGKAAREAAEQ